MRGNASSSGAIARVPVVSIVVFVGLTTCALSALCRGIPQPELRHLRGRVRSRSDPRRPRGSGLSDGARCASPSAPVRSVVTDDGGVSWSSYPITGSPRLLNVVCPTTTLCIAVGGNVGAGAPPVIVKSIDGGASWSTEVIPSGISAVVGVSCPSATDCAAVGTTASALEEVTTSKDGGNHLVGAGRLALRSPRWASGPDLVRITVRVCCGCQCRGQFDIGRWRHVDESVDERDQCTPGRVLLVGDDVHSGGLHRDREGVRSSPPPTGAPPGFRRLFRTG